MSSDIDPLRIRKVLGRTKWLAPVGFGSTGWVFKNFLEKSSVIVTTFEYDDIEWIHASMTRDLKIPSYEDLKLLHKAVFDQGYAYQMFVPEEFHININEYVLHLWGRLDGKPVLPDMGRIIGSI